jgi:monovalent cation/hydrogen antiporter
MDALTIVFVLLAGVVASSVLTRAARVPLLLPLVQITVGILIGQIFDFQVSLSPETFFLLFVAPLLFLDGWRMPREGLLHDKWTIFALAFGLVLFTVLGAGPFISWMIPTIPLPVAFALAAILSPTDAVAVSTIAARAPIPKRLMHILQGESLLNDASGLVCMRFAIAAAVSGTFSFVEASSTFLWLLIGGVCIGAAVAILANAAKDWIARNFGEETGSQIIISLLIPFAAYIAADRAAASGILAAVAAGIAMSHEERSGRASALTRIRRAAVWDALQFAGNGAIFVLLGYRLSGFIGAANRATHQTGSEHELWLLFYFLAISGALFVLRALWAWATVRLLLLRHGRSSRDSDMPPWRVIAVASFAGVRGAVTLAGVLTFPLVLRDGSAFPARDLAILLAEGVIVTTLLAANAALPYLLRNVQLPPKTQQQRQTSQARLAVAQAAIAAVERAVQDAKGRNDEDHYVKAGARIGERYQQEIQACTNSGVDSGLTQESHEIERKLQLVGLRAERAELYRMARLGELTDETARLMVREVDLQESQLIAAQPRA